MSESPAAPAVSRAPSTSTTEPTSKRRPAQRIIVRRRTSESFGACQATDDQMVLCSDGSVRRAAPGDWILYRGDQVLDVFGPQAFSTYYEELVSGLTLPPEALTELVQVLGAGTTQSAKALVTAVKALADCEVGKIKIDFTPGQWDTLRNRADKMGLTVPDLMKRIVGQLTEEIFAGRA